MASSRSIRKLPAAILAAALLAMPTIALANVNGTPASSQATAFPMTAGVTYNGDFQSQTETEYLSFQVPRAGTSLHFVLRNTTGSCVNPSSETPCPVFGTLIDAHGQQVGGEGSSAGTSRIDAGKSGVIDWTFTQAGPYWVAVDSSGDFPTFSISYRDVTKVLSSLVARSTQRGTAVRAVAKIGRPCKRIVARLARGSATLGKSVLRNVGTGRVPIKVPLNRAGRSLLARNHKLRLKLVVVATPTTGSSQTRSRIVTLKG